MKRIIIGIFMVFVMISIASCAKDTKNSNSEQNITDNIIGTHQNDIHKVFGNPVGKLSGFSGDMYTLDNGTTITVYYGENMEVEQVVIKDKDNTEVLTIK